MRGLVAVVTAAAILVVSPAAAFAHSGVAVIEVLEADAGDDLVIGLEIAVRYSADDEPAERAFLTATPTSPDGDVGSAVDLERGDLGVYRGEIEVDGPGTWELLISSAFPPGETSVAVAVGDDDRGATLLPVVAVAALGAAAVAIAGMAIVRRRRRLS